MNIRQVASLIAYDDGDNITPRMGVSIESGYGLQQYWDEVSKKVIETDFTKHPATLYPQAFSSLLGSVVVPETTGQQWYYNILDSSDAGILENGAVKAKFASLFEATTVTINGKTFPALKIKGNLATDADHTDKYIYYKSRWQDKPFTCQQLIPIQAAAGSQYDILLTVEGADGSGDDVLSNDNDWVKYTAFLHRAGEKVSSGVTFKFYRMSGGSWVAVSHTAGLYEIATADGSASLKLFNAAVEGVELYKAVLTYNTTDYEKVFEVTDIHDPFYIVPGCSIAGESVKKGETVTYNPQVFDRSTGELATGSYETSKWTFKFTFISRKTGKVVSSLTKDTLTYDNIKAAGGVTVVIEASI